MLGVIGTPLSITSQVVWAFPLLIALTLAGLAMLVRRVWCVPTSRRRQEFTFSLWLIVGGGLQFSVDYLFSKSPIASETLFDDRARLWFAFTAIASLGAAEAAYRVGLRLISRRVVVSLPDHAPAKSVRPTSTPDDETHSRLGPP